MAKKKATKKAAKKTAKKQTAEALLVGSKVKAILKDHGCNTGGDALDGLNTWAHWLIEQACKRAEANGRKTVRAHDFINM